MTPIAFIVCPLIILFLSNCGECTPLTPCPEAFRTCECRIPAAGLISIDCSRKDLAFFPKQIDGLERSVFHLDLSSNYFTQFPVELQNFSALESLDFSNNEITAIPETVALPPNLRHLYLANNNITNWMDINPSKLLVSAANLHTLSLAGNSLHSLTSNDERLLLISGSLKLLDLSDCNISKISGRLTISGLLTLEHLLLSGNPLRTLPQMKAEKLLSLDLSSCKITQLQRDVFQSMPILTYVNLSKNPRLSLQYDKDEYVQSMSLRRIDLAMCNMDAVELNGFPNLTTALLKGNLIKQLTWDTFVNNDQLENIDLSFNAITHITSGAFRRMVHLKNVDFSYNMLRKIESDTFRENNYLTSINLSRNYIDRFRRIAAMSLTYLNMSWCEIMNIDLDAFNDMPELIALDLSHNLIRDFPSSLHSTTLQIMDLSNCRLIAINNETFNGFPELSRLNLASNRFTTTLRTEHFARNPYLNDIWLGDNPWRCECYGYGLYEFYQYLTVPPARTNDRSYLRCASPEHVVGKHWNNACHEAWYPDKRRMGTAEKIWTFTMVFLILGSINFCIFLSFKKWLRSRAERRRETERMQVIDEARDLMRHNRRVLEQEAQLNAPDPRETRPPCYEDAILLPRLDSSFSSLKQLDSDNEERRKAAKRSRCRSEEVICSRDSDGASRPKRHILAARIRSAKPKAIESILIPSPTTRSPNTPSSPASSAHCYSTEILMLKHSPRFLHRANTTTDAAASRASSTSEFIIEPMERYMNFTGRSPYAQRKNGSSPSSSKNNTITNSQPLQANDSSKSSGAGSEQEAASSSSLKKEPSYCEIDCPEDIVIIDDHYRSKNSLNRNDRMKRISISSSDFSDDYPKVNIYKRQSTASSSSDDYTTFSKDEIQNVRRSQF